LRLDFDPVSQSTEQLTGVSRTDAC